MNSQIKPRALVIGGSLGGLFAATALRGSGWDVSVFERSPNDLDSRGGGIVLQPIPQRRFIKPRTITTMEQNP